MKILSQYQPLNAKACGLEVGAPARLRRRAHKFSYQIYSCGDGSALGFPEAVLDTQNQSETSHELGGQGQ